MDRRGRGAKGLGRPRSWGPLHSRKMCGRHCSLSHTLLAAAGDRYWVGGCVLLHAIPMYAAVAGESCFILFYLLILLRGLGAQAGLPSTAACVARGRWHAGSALSTN